jgi:imidazolonepropionase-like amidohydrolase
VTTLLAPPLRPSFASFGVTPENAAAAAKQWTVSMAVLRALHDAGVTVVAGTDQAVPGHSLHRELELYVAAGFTPLEAIQAATIVPARVMRRDRELGTLEAGKRADLVVIDGDPLADIRRLRRIVAVVRDGRVYDTAKLWRSVGFEP